LQDEWDWAERYPSQAQVLAYLRHVADRCDMRPDIQFDTRVNAAAFDEEYDLWTVTTDAGDQMVCRGEWYLTTRWLEEPVDFAGKRVAVIGTGASGIQVIPLVAAVASELKVFQCTANYALPSRNYTLDDYQHQAIKADYSEIWEQTGRQAMGMAINPANRVIGDVTPEEAQGILEAGWEEGGSRYFLEIFDDVFVDPKSNAIVSEFVRNKIRTIVKDPATAELLYPTDDHPIGAKRTPLGHYYFEAFNRDNVELIDVRNNSIVDIAPTGIRLSDGTVHKVDIIVFATGFDALTGVLTRIAIRGRAASPRSGRTGPGRTSRWPSTSSGTCS
jgi:cation diffusion facilitator CzcD-associated flavoprotein CzcO